MEKFIALGADGKPLNAKISYEKFEATETYFIESRSGRKNHPTSRNPDYNDALEVLLRAQQAKKSLIEDILVESSKAKPLPPHERRVTSPEYPLPIDLTNVDNISDLRKQVGNVVKKIAKAQNSKGGNSNKKLSIRFRLNRPQMNKGYQIKDFIPFHKAHFKNSGPPPSSYRKGTEKKPSDLGFVYAFWLKGLSPTSENALKVGYTQDLIARHSQLNKELHTPVTKLQWVEHTFFQFTNAVEAYNFEQELHYFLEEHRYVGEREIYRLSTEHFDDLLKSKGF